MQVDVFTFNFLRKTLTKALLFFLMRIFLLLRTKKEFALGIINKQKKRASLHVFWYWNSMGSFEQ